MFCFKNSAHLVIEEKKKYKIISQVNSSKSRMNGKMRHCFREPTLRSI